MKTITFLAEKGGVGKTTLASVVATAIAKTGATVLVLAFDIQGAAASVLLDEALPRTSGAAALLTGQPAEPVEGRHGIMVLTGGQDLDSGIVRQVRHDELRFALEKIQDAVDVVVIDCGPVLRHLHRLALDAADVAVIVTDTSAESQAGLARVLREIQTSRQRGTHAPRELLVVANKVAPRTTHDQVMLDEIRKSAQGAGASMIEIPHTTAIPSAIDSRRPEAAMTGNPAATALRALVTALTTDEVAHGQAP
jgi:chromosome partitioning protein